MRGWLKLLTFVLVNLISITIINVVSYVVAMVYLNQFTVSPKMFLIPNLFYHFGFSPRALLIFAVFWVAWNLTIFYTAPSFKNIIFLKHKHLNLVDSDVVISLAWALFLSAVYMSLLPDTDNQSLVLLKMEPLALLFTSSFNFVAGRDAAKKFE